jgi:hypothetical protein
MDPFRVRLPFFGFHLIYSEAELTLSIPVEFGLDRSYNALGRVNGDVCQESNRHDRKKHFRCARPPGHSLHHRSLILVQHEMHALNCDFLFLLHYGVRLCRNPFCLQRSKKRSIGMISVISSMNRHRSRRAVMREQDYSERYVKHSFRNRQGLALI